MLMDTLEECGYTGVFMYEVTQDPIPTIRRPRLLEPADFALNAQELFARAPLTMRGQPTVAL